MNYNKILNLLEEIRLLEDGGGNSTTINTIKKKLIKLIKLKKLKNEIEKQNDDFKLSLEEEVEFLAANVAREKRNDLYYEHIEYLCNYMGNPVSRLGISERDIKSTIKEITDKEKLADIKAFLKESDFDEEFKESALMELETKDVSEPLADIKAFLKESDFKEGVLMGPEKKDVSKSDEGPLIAETGKEQRADSKAFLKESDFDKEFKEGVLMGPEKKDVSKSDEGPLIAETGKEQRADSKAFLKESDFDNKSKESVLMGKKSIYKSCLNVIKRLVDLFSKLEIAAPIPGPYDSSCYASSCKSSDYHLSSQCAEATLMNNKM